MPCKKMGKVRRGHNWKARQQVETKVDKTEELKIKLEGYEKDPLQNEEESNPLILPSNKRKTKVKTFQEPKVKRLTKKERKRLEKVVERREKKAKRVELLQKLSEVQATPAEKALLTSTTEVYSGKYKRKLIIEETPSGHVKVNAIAGSNKKRKKVEAPVDEESSTESSEGEDSDTTDESEEEAGEQLKATEEEQSDSDNEDEPLKQVPAKPAPTAPPVTPNVETPDGVPRVHVSVDRLEEVQKQRLKLPILSEEQEVMEAVHAHPVIIICGETGSGKTTQVPQFLYEAGYAHGGGIIAVTEPRRVAAISMSKRIAHEMNLTSREVSYQIRYEGNATPDTKIKFMTDGVLLKEVQKDFLLTRYNVVVIDEAHERSVYTDILIGLLSRIVPLRAKKGNPLKLIIMSATLRVEDFTANQRLFKQPPPVVKVESRQFPVTIHFNKRTPASDYIGEAYKKVCKIHRMLPDGGILVFVTGQAEVHSLSAKLRRMFPFHKHHVNTGKHKRHRGKSESEDPEPELPKVSLDDYSILPLDEEAELGPDDGVMVGEDGEDEDGAGLSSDDDGGEVVKAAAPEVPLHVLPLYSLLAGDRQAKVFEPTPDGTRMVVVATNVAETSLTIPGIKYVVDTGRVKTKFYDKVTGVSTFKVTWTSQASANQRAGRAGRTGPGHAYRLYSSAVFGDFEKFAPPEIKRRPVEDLVLQMKDMSIDKVANFPFPTPPDHESLQAAEGLLVSLGALEKPPTPRRFKDAKKAKLDPASRITPLGRAMACFPVSPRYGKMLSLGHQHNLLPYVVALVAGLSVQDVFTDVHQLTGNQQEKEEQKQSKLKGVALRRTWAGSGNSLLLGDLMVLLKAVGACEFAGCTPSFCSQHGLRHKAMIEIRKLRAQLTNAVNAVISDADLVLDPKMAPPDDLQAKLLRQVVLAGLADHVARKMPTSSDGSAEAKKMKYAYQTLTLEDPVFVHPGSILHKQNHEYVVFQYIDETSKLYMKGVTAVEADWLPLFVTGHCHFSKPEEKPAPRYDPDRDGVLCHIGGTFGPHFWPLPITEVEYPDNLDKYKLFARFLLEGAVCSPLKKFVTSLLSTPSTMVKSWAKLQPRTETLLKTLMSENITSATQLRTVWTKDPTYLLRAYLEWIPESQHTELESMWPPT